MAMALLLADDHQCRRAMRRERVFRDRQNPLDQFPDDRDLIARYRFPRAVIIELIDSLGDIVEPVTRRSHAIPTSLKLLVSLSFYATGTFFRQTGDIAGITKPSVSRIVHAVSQVLAQKAQDYITFPNSAEEISQLKREFQEADGHFAGTIGLIDGTHIGMIAPTEDEYVFVNRKNFHSINCQGICDAKRRLLNWVVKYPGGTHDAFIWNNCDLQDQFERGQIPHGWLLGDSAYPLKPYLLTPFAVPRNHSERNYNLAHKKCRSLVERTFGVMKARFRCIDFTGGILQFSPERCVNVIASIGFLHNLAIDINLPDPPEVARFEDAERTSATPSG